MADTGDLLICFTCGTQFSTADRSKLTSCNICDDPRQYVPKSGQSFTTLSDLQASGKYSNNFTKLDEKDDKFWCIETSEKFGIGERAFFIKTPQGNVMFDCVAYIDDSTVDWITSQGGLKAIVISHPHYYTTHLEWARVFNCPVFISAEDAGWLNRHDNTVQAFIKLPVSTVDISDNAIDLPITILKVGGHFPGSLCLLAYDRLLIADTLVTTPSGLGDWSIIPSASTDGPANQGGIRPPGLNTFTFMYSIPNMIPLPPKDIVLMWEILKSHHFTSTHGAFAGLDVYDGYGGSKRSVKGRVLDSMQIQIRAMSFEELGFLDLKWED